jgi:hypothetical protein
MKTKNEIEENDLSADSALEKLNDSHESSRQAAIRRVTGLQVAKPVQEIRVVHSSLPEPPKGVTVSDYIFWILGGLIVAWTIWRVIVLFQGLGWLSTVISPEALGTAQQTAVVAAVVV